MPIHTHCYYRTHTLKWGMPPIYCVGPADTAICHLEGDPASTLFVSMTGLHVPGLLHRRGLAVLGHMLLSTGCADMPVITHSWKATLSPVPRPAYEPSCLPGARLVPFALASSQLHTHRVPGSDCWKHW